MCGEPALSDDVAVRRPDQYRQLLEDGVEDGEATRLTVEAFREYLKESGGIALVALAVTQSKLVASTPGIRDRALAISMGAPISRCGSATIRNYFPSAAPCSRKRAHN